MQKKRKVDCESNKWLAATLVSLSAETNVFAATSDCEENYGVDDIWISALTLNGNFVALPMENKTIKGGFQLKYDGEWNEYFSTTNPNGIVKKLSGDTIPTSGHVYFVNAEDANGNQENGKWQKMLECHACLAYLAPDGFILFSPKTLTKAFLGFVYYRNKSHTEELSNNVYDPHWELKALINLDEGRYFKASGPIEIFIK